MYSILILPTINDGSISAEEFHLIFIAKEFHMIFIARRTSDSFPNNLTLKFMFKMQILLKLVVH